MLKYYFSFCHLDNAMLFKDLTDSDILEVENFVREKLLTILKSKANFNAAESNMKHFFGENFQSRPNQFKFQIGDMKLIRLMISHVKKIVENGNVAHFKSISTKTTTNEKPKSDDAARTYFFLNKLKTTADQNAIRERGGYRFDDETKNFAMYLRIISGPLAYNTLQKNLKCALPSLPSINRYIQSSNCTIYEGIPRIEELYVYLNNRHLPLAISLSEDATRIIGRIQYHSSTNQLIGFAVPINKQNGIPVPFAFPARNADEIISHFSNQNSPSQYLNVMMAQPLADVPPFCLMIYGSVNTYTTREVVNRWNYIKTELNKKNIEVVSFSTDSEPRYNSAMRFCSKLGINSNINHFPPFYIQDMTHIATKLRNFFLNKMIIPFGKRFIKVQHLVFLLANFRKDQHELTATTLNPKDRQNFASVQRICDSKMIHLLKSSVDKSEATVIFLEMTRDIIESYMDLKLSPLERVRKIYYPLFVIRMWRNFVSESKKFILKDNFLSANCYACIELNASSLVELMLYLRKSNKESFFLPHLMSSQPCESTFRQFRSLTSTYSTVTNCTVKEALSRINKIQLQNEIIHLTSPNFIYPKLSKQFGTTNTHRIPTEKEIRDVIAQCKRDAINTAIYFNLISASSSERMKEKATSCQVKPYVPKRAIKPKIIPAMPTKTLTVSDFKNIALKNYAEKKSESINQTSPYLEFHFSTKRIVVKKSSFCWLLRDDVKKMSNDRLLRVRTQIYSNKINNKPKAKQAERNTAFKHKKGFNFTLRQTSKY